MILIVRDGVSPGENPILLAFPEFFDFGFQGGAVSNSQPLLLTAWSNFPNKGFGLAAFPRIQT
jgi:hypothetical protein